MKSKHNRGFTLIELVVCIVIVVVLFGIAGLGCTRLIGNGNYSEGYRSGLVSKFSNKGNIYKTHEGELVQGGLRTTRDFDGNTGVSGNVWAFSVDNDNLSVIKDIETAVEKGRPVRLKYHEVRWNGFFIKPDTYYRIDKVFPVEDDPKK